MQKVKIEITGQTDNSECKPIYCRRFCPEIEFVSPPEALGSNQGYTNTTIRLIPPLDEPVTVYFSTTGTVQYLTFSNNSVNISSEDEEVSCAANDSVGYPPGGTTTIGAKPNNSSGGKNVGQTTMTLLDVSMDTAYAGRIFHT